MCREGSACGTLPLTDLWLDCPAIEAPSCGFATPRTGGFSSPAEMTEPCGCGTPPRDAHSARCRSRTDGRAWRSSHGMAKCWRRQVEEGHVSISGKLRRDIILPTSLG